MCGKLRQRLAKIDQVREPRLPVVEEGEILTQLAGLFGDAHVRRHGALRRPAQAPVMRQIGPEALSHWRCDTLPAPSPRRVVPAEVLLLACQRLLATCVSVRP